MRLLNATIASVSEGGYSRATLTEITQRAGVSIGAAQHHFQSKADLILATVEYIFTEMHLFLSGFGPTDGPLEERLDKMISMYWSWFSSPEYLAAWELILGARHDPDLLEQLRARVALGVEPVNDLWKAAFSDIEMSDDEVRQLVQFTFSTMRGLVLRDTVILNGEPNDKEILGLMKNMLRFLMEQKSERPQ